MSDFDDDVIDDDAFDECYHTDDEEPAVEEVAQAATTPPIDLERIAKSLARVPTKDPLFTELVRRVLSLQQSHGDADAALSLELVEIESALRLHVLFIHRDPGAWVLSILAARPPAEQATLITQLIGDLERRKAQILPLLAGEGA